MSTTNSSLVKRSFKIIEVPLNKFTNEVIPHHQELLLKHKTNIQQLSKAGEYDQLDRELRDKTRVVRQLRELMYELDTLRTQVEDNDLDKFDGKTFSLRKIILELINGYSSVETHTRNVIEEYNNENNIEIAQQIPQIQMHDIEPLQLEELENQFNQVEALNRDIQDVQNIFVEMNKMVVTQADQLDVIETNTEVAHDNVRNGLLQIIKAARLQKTSYPIAGAFVGTLVGGPIGSVAGLKIGALVSIGCGVAGYVGGKFFKRASNEEVLETEMELEAADHENSVNTARCAVTDTRDKKNI